MDFFEHQDKARRSTKWLILYFGLAVVCIALTVYAVALFGMHAAESRYRRGPQPAQFSWWNVEVFGWAVGGTLVVITLGSVFKISELASGGKAVAQSLGGRLVPPNSSDPLERKLLNVVEEMALAAGLPVPQVYVMDRESGINAFAAGNTPSDAVVGVTRGCMELLNRDELQGVIAHEFSHILNGDMRLNLRLMGIIFGILCLTVIGRILIYTRGQRNPLPLVGLVLILIGWTGVLFGRLIQSAVSRQREFLADASAVQFTRNPLGLSGALQKIGGLHAGSRLQSPHAEEASHMFFGNGLKPSMLSGFATHPPLEARIRAIDPSWDGKFPRIEAKGMVAEVERVLHSPEARRGSIPQGAVQSLFAGGTPTSGPRPTVQTATVIPSLGRPTPLHLRYAEELREAIPASLRDAAHESKEAAALMFALVLSPEPALRGKQLHGLGSRTGEATATTAERLVDDLSTLASHARLPLVELTLPALRSLSPTDYAQFSQALHWLIQSDQQVDFFEFVLLKIVNRHLAPNFVRARPPAVQFYAMKPLAPDCAVLLSALAHMGGGDDATARRAFTQGAPYLRSDVPVSFLARERCGLAEIDAALDRLALAAPQIKKNLITACVYTVGADGVINEREAELLRAICDTLDCPIPPLVQMEG